MMPHRPAAERTRRRDRSGGQSLVEFALLLPLMLAFVGLSLDFARVYQAWITLESATRDAAEYAATTALTSTEAETEAWRVICLQAQALPGYEAGSGSDLVAGGRCAAPSIALVSFDVSTAAAVGASSRNPVVSATVRSSLPFRPMFPWPILTSGGTWTVTSTSTFSIIQGR
jgi:Flp pilus assembly protein TadG